MSWTSLIAKMSLRRDCVISNDLQLTVICVAPEYEELPHTDTRRPIIGGFVSFLPGMGSYMYLYLAIRQDRTLWQLHYFHLKHNNKNTHRKASRFYNIIPYRFYTRT